jgi:hypothetical protein
VNIVQYYDNLKDKTLDEVNNNMSYKRKWKREKKNKSCVASSVDYGVALF